MSAQSPHLRVQEVADLAEGLLDPAEAAAARAHLDSCAQCRGIDAQLTVLQRVLAAEGASPTAMPAAVAERIDAALVRRSQARERWPRLLVAAASIVVVAGAVGLGVQQLADQGEGAASDMAGGGAGKPVFEKGGGAESRKPERDTAATPATGQAFDAFRLDRERFSAQVRKKLSAGQFTARTELSVGNRAGLADRCVRQALAPQAAAGAAFYPARLDGKPVTLVVEPRHATSRMVFAVACAGKPRVLATASLP